MSFTKTNLKKLFIIGSLAIFFPVLLIAPQSHSQLPAKLKADDQAYRDYMVKISRQLGVTCSACHNPANFASADKIQFKVSKEHIRITQTLIDSGFDGQGGHPMADCFMCHRGKLRPDFREPFDPMTMKKAIDAKPGNDKPKPGEKSPDED